MADNFDALTETLLEKETWVVDLLPRQVCAERADAWFAAERFFMEKSRLRALYAKFAVLLVKLGCYYDLALCAEDIWKERPSPCELWERITGCAESVWCNVLLPDEESLITLSGGDLYLTLYHPSEQLRETVRQLALAEGLFLRPEEEAEENSPRT